ncbi:hypothetical protein ACFLZN_00535 [Nanoarchaeota archaeon]
MDIREVKLNQLKLWRVNISNSLLTDMLLANWRDVDGIRAQTKENMPYVINKIFPILINTGVVSSSSFSVVSSDVLEIMGMLGETDGHRILYEILNVLKDTVLSSIPWSQIKYDLIEIIDRIGRRASDVLSSFFFRMTAVGLLSASNWPIIKEFILSTQEKLDTHAIIVLDWGVSLLRENGLSSIDDLLNPVRILTKKGFRCGNYAQISAFLGLLLIIDKKDLEEPLKMLISILASGSYTKTKGENYFPVMNSLFAKLVQLQVYLEIRRLLLKLRMFLPVGGKTGLFLLVRQQAIDIQVESKDILKFLRLKIHSAPGSEDVEIVQAYINFLNTGNVNELEELYVKYNIMHVASGSTGLERVSPNFDFLQRTRKIAFSLLKNLEVLWGKSTEEIVQKSQSMKEVLKKFEFNNKLRRIANKVIISLEMMEEALERDDFITVANLIGSLKLDIRVLENNSTGELREELHFFVAILSNIEQDIHSDILKNIDLTSWESCIRTLLGPLMQKLSSAIAEYHGHPIFKEVLLDLMQFIHKKDLQYLQRPLGNIEMAIAEVTSEITDDFRTFLNEKFKFNMLEVETYITPFYRIGVMFQLDQLAQKLRQISTDSKGKVSKDSLLGKLIETSTSSIKIRKQEAASWDEIYRLIIPKSVKETWFKNLYRRLKIG